MVFKKIMVFRLGDKNGKSRKHCASCKNARFQERRLLYSGVAFFTFGILPDKSLAVESWDLAVDPDYSARTAKQLQTFLKLVPPNIAFLDNKTVAVTYPDGEGAWQSDIENRTRPYSPTHKFHALIFDVNEGPGKARKFAWEAYSERSQFLPTEDGGFAVRVDNHFMVYSRDYQLEREMQPPYYGNKPLPTGEPFFREMFWLGVSQTGKSLAICHVLIGRHDSGGTQFSLYDAKSLRQIGQTSDLNKNVNGCYSGFNVTDNAVFGGVFMFQPEAGTWRLVDPRCINCNGPAPADKNWSVDFDLFDETHVLFDHDVVDLDGHELYKILPSSDKGARVDRPDRYRQCLTQRMRRDLPMMMASPRVNKASSWYKSFTSSIGARAANSLRSRLCKIVSPFGMEGDFS